MVDKDVGTLIFLIRGSDTNIAYSFKKLINIGLSHNFMDVFGLLWLIINDCVKRELQSLVLIFVDGGPQITTWVKKWILGH